METYDPEQTKYLLDQISVEVLGETWTHWLCLCPFHGNMNSPAMVVDKEQGLFFCNNPSCDASGKMSELIRSLTKKTEFQIKILLSEARSKTDFSEDTIFKQLEQEPIVEFSKDVIARVQDNLLKDLPSLDYLNSRGIETDTAERFGLGASPNKGLVWVPMYMASGMPVGMIGRSIEGKVFKNTPGLPKGRSLYNIQNAKRNPRTVLVESSFDAIRVWQATGIDAVATLGTVTPMQIEQLSKYFDKLIIMTDDDDMEKKEHCSRCRKIGKEFCSGHRAGWDLGRKVVDNTNSMTMLWAHTGENLRFNGKKDVGEMTDEEINYAVTHAVSDFDMERLNLLERR